MHDRWGAGYEKCMTGGVQEMKNARQEECRTKGIHDRRGEGNEE